MLWFFEFFFPVVWIAFLIYWRIKAAGTKTNQRSEPALLGILRALAFLVVIVLLSTTRIPLPWLYRQLWPSGIWPFWIGAAVTVVGLLFAVWARQHLASNWSSPVTTKQGHELITTGPLCPGPSPHLYWHSDWVSWHRDCAFPGARGHRFRPNIRRALGQAPHGGEVDAFPVWGDVFRLRPSDRGPGAVPFLIAMCHEPPHARNGSSQLRSTSYQSAQALHSAPGRGGGQHPLRMLLSFCDVRADRKFARGPWSRHPLMYGTRGCKGTRPVRRN
jgi:hypothetical protein